MDTDTRTGVTSSYTEKFSSKEAVELATLQFNSFPCVYIPKASLAKLCTSRVSTLGLFNASVTNAVQDMLRRL